jgi:hypothetical protein
MPSIRVHVDRKQSLQRYDSVNGFGPPCAEFKLHLHNIDIVRRKTGVAMLACSVKSRNAVVSWPCPGPRHC